VNFLVKVHIDAKERLLALCDPEILGKKYQLNGVNITVKERFYGGEEYSPTEVLIEINRCTSLNAFGSNICQFLIDNNIVHPASVLWIEAEDSKVGHVILVK